MATKTKKNTPPVLPLLDEPVIEAPKVHPPARLAASVNALQRIIDSTDSGAYRRLTEPTTQRELATRVVTNLRSAAKWMQDNQKLSNTVDVAVHKYDTGINNTARNTTDTFAVYARVEGGTVGPESSGDSSPSQTHIS